MHYRKCLANQIDRTIPEWLDKFISYKELEKRLRSIGDGHGVSLEETEFVKLLEIELDKFNAFFVEKEEDYVIKFKNLQERFASTLGVEEDLIKVRKEVVDFHGEIVSLENYSAINYTGLVKILQKYDKKTGALLRLPFIRRPLKQQFFTMDLLYDLLNQCERLLDCLLPSKGKSHDPSQELATLYSPLTAENVSLKVDELSAIRANTLGKLIPEEHHLSPKGAERDTDDNSPSKLVLESMNRSAIITVAINTEFT